MKRLPLVVIPLLLGACGPDTADQGDGSGSSGDDGGCEPITDSGSPGDTDDGATTGDGECEMYPRVEFEEAGDCFEDVEMTVAYWSDSGLRLESADDTVEVTWPEVAGYPTVRPAQGDSVLASLTRCWDTSWSHYLRVSDADGRLLWEGGGLPHWCDGECGRLVYSETPSAEECEHHNGLFATPMSVQVTADETLILGAHESAEVCILGDRYVVHALTSEWMDTEQCADCADLEPISSSAYLARLE